MKIISKILRLAYNHITKFLRKSALITLVDDRVDDEEKKQHIAHNTNLNNKQNRVEFIESLGSSLSLWRSIIMLRT